MGREEDIAAAVRLLVEAVPDNPPGEPRSVADPPKLSPVRNESLAQMPSSFPGVRFRPEITLGSMVAMIPTLAAVVVLIWNTSAHNSAINARAEQLARELKSYQEQTARDIKAIQERGTVYAPKVESLDQSNKVQDERITTMALGLRDIRQDLSSINTRLGAMGEDMATVRARLNVGRRSELTQPQEAR